MKLTPSLRALRVASPTPLQGATPAAGQSPFRGVPRGGRASLVGRGSRASVVEN